MAARKPMKVPAAAVPAHRAIPLRAAARRRKMVRDKLYQRIPADELEVATADEYADLLAMKLLEEVAELMATGCLDVGEFADVHEVLLALEHLAGLTPEAVEAARQAKLADRGGFDVGLVWNPPEPNIERSGETRLALRWSKRAGDFVIHAPASGHGSALHHVLCCPQRTSAADSLTKQAWTASFLQELEALGYDLTTLKFECHRRPDVAGVQPQAAMEPAPR